MSLCMCTTVQACLHHTFVLLQSPSDVLLRMPFCVLTLHLSSLKYCNWTRGSTRWHCSAITQGKYHLNDSEFDFPSSTYPLHLAMSIGGCSCTTATF